jgi:hypothetical protein
LVFKQDGCKTFEIFSCRFGVLLTTTMEAVWYLPPKTRAFTSTASPFN